MMVTRLISGIVVIVFGVLYPAYQSHLALKCKDTKAHVKWMMYWIVFAVFYTMEHVADVFLCWIPFYYELKMLLILYLLCPYTRGASMIYRKVIYPFFADNEREINATINQVQRKGYDTLAAISFHGFQLVTHSLMCAVVKGQAYLAKKQIHMYSKKHESLTVTEFVSLSEPEEPRCAVLPPITSQLTSTTQKSAFIVDEEEEGREVVPPHPEPNWLDVNANQQQAMGSEKWLQNVVLQEEEVPLPPQPVNGRRLFHEQNLPKFDAEIWSEEEQPVGLPPVSLLPVARARKSSSKKATGSARGAGSPHKTPKSARGGRKKTVRV